MNTISRKTRTLPSQPRTASRIGIVMLGACILSLAVSAFAQSSSSGTHHAKPATHSATAKMPKSVPNAPAATTTARSTAASRTELERLEHAAPKAAAHHSARQTTRIAAVDKSHSHNQQINFSYRGPSNGQAGHINPSKH
jgi:hypothetical protein